jgi:FKBP-type peptidyl-prolyl cis-trans isomerase FklB
MKTPAYTLTALLLWGAGATAAEQAAPENDQERVNYNLGYELGKELQREALELNTEMVLQGARDAIAGSEALVSKSQRMQSLRAIKLRRAEDNLEKSRAFLEANANKEGVKRLPSGVQYRELRAGNGKSPQAKSKVTVNYRGSLIDGSEFDSSAARGKPATFHVARVIKGWREALLLMREGAKWELFIPPELAYGKRGRPGKVPPNSALLFEVELLEVK